MGIEEVARRRVQEISKKALLEVLKTHPGLEFQNAVTGQTFNIAEAKMKKAIWVNVRYNEDRDVAVLELAKVL